MDKNKNTNIKINKIDYSFVFLLVIYIGGATVFARSLGDVRTIGNAVGLLATIYFAYYHKIKITSNLIVVILVFLLYASLTTIYNGRLSPWWISQSIIYIIVTYVTVRGLKFNFFYIYEKVLYDLCLIALILYIPFLFIPDTLIEIMKIFRFSLPYSGDINENVNSLVYTVNYVTQYSQRTDGSSFFTISRNSGFAWEPGAFSIFVCYAIGINLLKNGVDFSKNNKRLWIFILTLLTTQSATGIMTFLTMIVTALILDKRGIKYLIIAVPFIVCIFSLPFVRDKLIEQFIMAQEMGDTAEGTYSLNRFQAFLYYWNEFLKHPFIGFGGNSGSAWWLEGGKSRVVVSGIGHMLGAYGAIISSLLIYMSIRSCRLINSIAKSKLGYLFFIILFGTMISYMIWQQPIFLILIMFSVFYPRNNTNKFINQTV